VLAGFRGEGKGNVGDILGRPEPAMSVNTTGEGNWKFLWKCDLKDKEMPTEMKIFW
jgi:hypothetical protein